MTLRSPVMGWAAHYHPVAEECRCASQQKLRADVADGSNPVLHRCRLNVRITPESGRAANNDGRRRSAKSGCEQSQQRGSYSITSSARASSVISKPSASDFFEGALGLTGEIVTSKPSCFRNSAGRL